jgi:hypothetical protein
MFHREYENYAKAKKYLEDAMREKRETIYAFIDAAPAAE